MNRTNNRRRPNRGRNRANRVSVGVRTGNGPSRADTAINRRTLKLYGRLAVANTTSGIAFGLGSFAFKADASQHFANEYIKSMAGHYEQYRVRRIRVYAAPGANMTNDIRIKTVLMARVDPDEFPGGSTASNLGLLTASSNTVSKKLNDSVEGTLLADFNPICHPYKAGSSTSDGRMLPNNLSWMMLRDGNDQYRYHLDEWRGCYMALTIPDGSDVSTQVKVQLRFRIDLEFRGRQVHGASFTSLNITEPKPVEFTDSLVNLRNGFLTGQYQPIDGWTTINVANIGTSVLGPDLIDCTYRRNSDSVYYKIITGDDTEYGAEVYVPE